MQGTNRPILVPIFVILFASALMLAFLFWILYVSPPAPSGSYLAPFPRPPWIRPVPGSFPDLAPLNALFNVLTVVQLMAGMVAIKKGWRKLHQGLMCSATATSFFFLVGYILHHYHHGATPYSAEGGVRFFYFFILISHILLSVVQLPLILLTHFFAWTAQFFRHKKIAKWTFPIWCYVSVTGVVIFIMLNLERPVKAPPGAYQCHRHFIFFRSCESPSPR